MASDFSTAMLNARGRRAVVASLQDDLQWSLPPGIYTWCSPLPCFNRVGLCEPQRILQKWWYLTSKIRYKRHCSFCAGCTPTLLGHSFWNKPTAMQGPRHWGTEVFCHQAGRNSLSTTTMSEPFWKKIF